MQKTIFKHTAFSMKTITLIISTSIATAGLAPFRVQAGGAAVVDITDSNQDLAGRVARMENMLNNQGMINILNEVEMLNEEVRQLRGQVEEQAYTIKQLEQRQKSLYDDLDRRIQSNSSDQSQSSQIDPPPIVEAQPVEPTDRSEEIVREELQGESPVPTPTDVVQRSQNYDPATTDLSGIQPVETYRSGAEFPANTPSPQTEAGQQTPALTDSQPAPQEQSRSDQAEADYAIAFSLLKEGKHDQSVDQFRTFLQNYPSSDYADNAQYWIGESFYARRQYETALNEYRSLLAVYPDSGKASHAQLKIGYSLDELGQHDLAQGELEDLIARYPGTSAAQLANERLKLIRSR